MRILRSCFCLDLHNGSFPQAPATCLCVMDLGLHYSQPQAQRNPPPFRQARPGQALSPNASLIQDYSPATGRRRKMRLYPQTLDSPSHAPLGWFFLDFYWEPVYIDPRWWQGLSPLPRSWPRTHLIPP